MAVEATEIDLYADDLGEEFNQENEYNETGLDLYDDVITPSGNIKREEEDYGLPQDNGTAHHVNSNDAGGDVGSCGPPQKKIGIYVGNLSWWTTDQDVTDSILDLGINDIFEVKFFENRANGQSKGFCVVTLGSDNSVRSVIEKLPKNEIHGQNPVVTPCNRQNLNHFEMQSRKTAPGGPGGGPQHVGGQQSFPNNRSGFGGPPQGGGGMRPPLIQRPIRPNGPLIPGQPRMGMPPHQGMPFGGGQPQWGPQMGPNAPPRPPAPIHPGAPPMANMPLMRMPPQPNRGPPPQQPLLRGPSTQNDPRTQMAPPGGPMPDWANDHPPHGHGPPGPQNMVMPQVGQPQPNPSMPPRGPSNDYSGPVPGMPPVPGTHPGGPAPHVNPAFFQAQHHQGLPPTQQTDQFGNRLGPSVQYGHGHGDFRGPVPGLEVPIALQISEQEFEEIMGKNRTVSSSAISRAVTDASSGDFPAAIETLVTAISLIKQSKVANDERCKILISSLQDTLHGIETKSYGNSSSRKDRPRSRERSRERSSRREKSRRERSRSRERDYRDRSRDRYHEERYHDERYREKDRERERDHRSSRH